MIKAIIFDCFSVLIGDASKAAANELWHTNPDKAKQFQAVAHAVDKGILAEDEAIAIHANLLGLTVDALKELRNKGEVRNAELLRYIETALRGRYKLAVVSNISSRARLDIRFLPGELDTLFDVVIASGEVGYIKPQPEIFYIAAERLGVEPEECVILDDIADFCEGARAVGMNAIQYVTNKQAITELNTLIDRGGEKD